MKTGWAGFYNFHVNTAFCNYVTRSRLFCREIKEKKTFFNMINISIYYIYDKIYAKKG